MTLSVTGQMLAQRDAFGDTLVELIDRDERVYVLDGDLAIKIAAGWNLVNGLSGWLAPDIAAKLPWEGSASSGQAQLATGVGAAIYALNTGKDATQAIGYSVLPSLVGGLMDGMPEGNAMVSTLIQATVVAATLF